MILVDTSVWIDHLRRGVPDLVRVLEESRVGTHPWVIGELALGGLRLRGAVLENLARLPIAPVASHDEILWLVDRHPLFGRGLALVDAHLLASVLLAPGWSLWTRDKRLRAAADEVGLALV